MPDSKDKRVVEKNIRAKVIKNEEKGTTAKTVDGKPVKVGDMVDVDSDTFRNLQKKGWLEKAK